ncbi:rhodanese-like domain-containing protein [Desulfovibrio ferrophilus]|uniref:Sulfurtransferase n=1 Tax=Desulfovibrio ferrophilus TaxID=241368 RepID=A0A2Z6B2I8_9BACT|nr:rhodanese-like domain-containing protein [Desulfovibrio ferrophilus]BBD09673.1 sulfurtransferase [Desulfovibrio ferrophilus]
MNWKILIMIIALWALWDLAMPLFGIRQMPPWELRKRIALDTAPVMLDVRSPLEYAWFHIPGAINVPFPPPSAVELGIPKDAEIVLICMTGHRSPVAAWQLKKAGYENVSNLTWGSSAYALLGGRTKKGEAP